MEIHAPKDPMKTVKEFLGRIGTAVFGFLIALLLNSGVGKLNAIQQRHSLMDSLRTESQKNLVIMEANNRFYDGYMRWADGMETEVDQVTKNPPKAPLQIHLPPDWNPADLLDPKNAADISPTSTVYTASRDSGLFSVLSTEESRVVASVYRQHETMAVARSKFLDTVAARQEFECKFSPGTPPCAPYLSRMSKQDLNEYLALLAKTELAAYNMQMNLDHVTGAHHAIANGHITEEAVVSGIREEMALRHRIPPTITVEDPNAQ